MEASVAVQSDVPDLRMRDIDHWPEPDAEVAVNEVVQTVAKRALTIKQDTLLSLRCERSRQGLGGDR
jgi:hypothetical protein